MEELIVLCQAEGTIKVNDAKVTADLVFVMVDGAYYYLSLVADAEEYDLRLKRYKDHVFGLLHIV